MGIVKGRVVLSRMLPELEGIRFLVVEAVTAENLEARNDLGGGSEVIVADHLAPQMGQLVGFVEGPEGCHAYYPKRLAIDAYCSLVLDSYNYRKTV